MENASKALLIAAGVVIVILLIAFGMRIFNSTGDIVGEKTKVSDHVSLESRVVTIDLKFSKYNGTQKGTVVKKMLEEVIEYNRNQNYKPGDTTTNYIRRIAIYFEGQEITSNTQTDIIEGYYNAVNENAVYEIKTEKYREDTNKAAVYVIFIYPR